MSDAGAGLVDRDALVDIVLHVKTRADCEKALELANDYLQLNPDDLDLRMMLEVPWLLLDAYKSGLL